MTTFTFNLLRKFHNYIKKKFLTKYSGKRLLDLASGKGGDIHKWINNPKIQYVRGYDISQESVIEANNRLSKVSNSKNTDIKFFIKDLTMSGIVLPKIKYDIITSFFAFHYFFKNETTLARVLTTINNSSKPGTFLLLTLFDGDKLLDLPSEYIKKHYYITRTSLKSIIVKINETVLDKPELEYIVTKQKLIESLITINFSLVEIVPFKDLYLDKFSLTSEEKSLSFLNNVYVFVKF